LSPYGIVYRISPREWADTGVLFRSWQVEMEVEHTLPPLLLADTDFPIIVETLGKCTVCRHCLSTTHNKPTCRLAKSAADQKADKQAKRHQKCAAANRRHRACKEKERA